MKRRKSDTLTFIPEPFNITTSDNSYYLDKREAKYWVLRTLARLSRDRVLRIDENMELIENVISRYSYNHHTTRQNLYECFDFTHIETMQKAKGLVFGLKNGVVVFMVTLRYSEWKEYRGKWLSASELREACIKINLNKDIYICKGNKTLMNRLTKEIRQCQKLKQQAI